ncbi:hypothetical protein [Halomonas dongshanensis]|uniref:Uncharacterized protein n=1 Tax=Halomonas dongshanensis TaxID=2890835 RepID=A0ABT2EFA2_9GAMM|nr:hypothetical protein [Halomonas dongshanensis]MCS2609292.1 hypothetical protein [Halomonas dongshanensis]
MPIPIYILDDRYEVTTHPHEMRMSLWVYAPVIVERATQRVILDLSGSLWDLRRVAEGEGRIILTLARYPEGVREYVIEVDPIKSTVIVQGSTYALAHIDTALSAIG